MFLDIGCLYVSCVFSVIYCMLTCYKFVSALLLVCLIFMFYVYCMVFLLFNTCALSFNAVNYSQPALLFVVWRFWPVFRLEIYQQGPFSQEPGVWQQIILIGRCVPRFCGLDGALRTPGGPKRVTPWSSNRLFNDLRGFSDLYRFVLYIVFLVFSSYFHSKFLYKPPQMSPK